MQVMPGGKDMDGKHIIWALALATLGCAHSEPAQKTIDPASTIAVSDQGLVSERGVPGQAPLSAEQAGEEKALNSDEPLPAEQEVSPASAKAECERAVFFQNDSAALQPEARRQLSRVAACLKRHDVDHALVVGAADARGNTKRNEELALERAKAVAAYLKELGVADDDIRVRARDEMASAEARQLWPLEKQATVSVPVAPEERARTAD
jgi:outer membrane protein OmpA-like peptidoglycan-associated protein